MGNDTGIHNGRIYMLSGPSAIDFKEISYHFSQVTMNQIKYVGLSESSARKYMSTSADIPEWIVESHIEIWKKFNEGSNFPLIFHEFSFPSFFMLLSW